MQLTLNNLSTKKKQLDGMRPLPPEQLKNLEQWYKVELTYTSNAIEGNTLTRAETALVIEKGITVKGKSLVEHLEARNHAIALDYVKILVRKKREQLTEDDILKIHTLILQGVDDPNAGHYRAVPVRIAGTSVVLPNYVKVPELMTEFMEWLVGKNDDHPVHIAAEAHYRLVSIHPFVDGNGRTARLLMNLLLMQEGYPPAIIRPEDRHDYITSLEKGQLGGSTEDYYQVIYDAVDRSLDVYIGAEKGQTVEVAPKKEAAAPILVRRSELAEIAGLRPSTVKYYTEQGLLPYDQGDAGLARYYKRGAALERLRRINGLKTKGLSIEEIKQRLEEE